MDFQKKVQKDGVFGRSGTPQDVRPIEQPDLLG
jgi:hypothetical protein